MNEIASKPEEKYVSGGSFQTTIGRTTYTVNVYFNKDSRVTLDEKIKRLIRQDVKEGKF